ncbi:MAG: hypothetical protein JWP01_3618 [Myxococcales bacterium]|nr:hypothetical protein [Myxococcales bacterium]
MLDRDPVLEHAGTALGAYLADSSGLGFAGGALLIGGLLVLILAARHIQDLEGRAALAGVRTHPYVRGPIGDVLTKPTEKGRIGLGTVGSSMIMMLVLVLFVIENRRRRRPAHEDFVKAPRDGQRGRPAAAVR